ncbi:MAG TPA: cobalamin-dependent protein [Syntrophales bacterium]|nr:cobalamin-dependent protein [Syntrophales bacterium]HPC00796.1 cobalamin-dependent protein [Syntrophales bacterium]HPQ06006.1 cobalamin-dependent protein [Syntrophales bacterium]HRS86623.1 cobalamin-dependent protein [Syntrophales bacterium]HRV42245.1 cobalamin-dependent protein [Syntrophales bacterium]
MKNLHHPPVHPKRTRANILLAGVFGPYAQDDEYGSRRNNPMELYHNQVTRLQGGFSLRMFHRTFGLLMIQANLDAPCTVMDFPKREDFVAALKKEDYDIVGIGAIVTNIDKVREMCRLVRLHRPEAQIVVGGHIAAVPDLHLRIDADFIVRGDGIRWFRLFLGQDEKAPIRHPMVLSGFGSRIMGINLPNRRGHTAAILIPSVGCPVGCNFCSTSAFFGGKGRFVNFYETGDELYSVMCQMEETLGVRSFFVLDENFLLHRRRALRLLELMEENGKSWSLDVFSSARVLQTYTMDQLVRLGITWVWMGLEGEDSAYVKLSGVSTHTLVKRLQDHGIRVLGSSIIGLEEHRQADMERVIDYAVSHDTDFHQFMLYTPNPGTPLYEAHEREGNLLSEEELPLADRHGQYRFNYRHRGIPAGSEEGILLDAFRRDFEVNGPSLYRLIRTMLKGWKRHGHDPDPAVRDRYAWDTAPLKTAYAGAVWAMKRWYHNDTAMASRLEGLLRDLYGTFGLKTRLAAPLFGLFALASLAREERRLKRGWTYEPQRFVNKNAAALGRKKEKAFTLPVAVPQPAGVAR